LSADCPSSLPHHRREKLSSFRLLLPQHVLQLSRIRRLISIASLLMLFASDTLGGPIPPKVIVDGTAVTTTAIQPERIDGEWYLPAKPIAEVLQYRLRFDPLSLHVTLEDPAQQRVLRYDAITGEVTDNDVAQMYFAPGLALGSDKENLQLPLSLVAALLDMEAWVSPSSEQISLTRRGSQYRTGQQDLRSFRMREVRYDGNGSRVGIQDGADLTLRSIGDLRRGDVRANLSLRGASRSSLEFRSASASYWNGTNRRISAGDISGSGGLSWQRASGRGLSWVEEQGRGQHRYAISAVQLLSGTSGDIARGSPLYDRHAISASYTMGARPGAPEGASLAFGATWTEGTEVVQSGALIAAESFCTRSGLRLESRTGFFLGDPSRSKRPSWDVLGHWSPWKPLRVQGRAFDYAPGFQLPNAGFGGEDRRLYSYGGSFALGRHLHIQGNQVHQRQNELGTETDDDDSIFGSIAGDPVEDDPSKPDVDKNPDSTASNSSNGIWESYSTLGLGLQTRRDVLRNLTITSTIPDENATTGRWNLLTSARGGTFGIDWFAHHRRQMNVREPAESFTTGLRRNIGPIGRFQVTGSWFERSHRGGSVVWSPPSLRSRHLHLTLGQRWVIGTDETTFRSFGRLRWKFLDNHSIDVSIHETSADPSIRIAFKGGWSFRKSSNRTNLGMPRALRHVGELGGRIYLDRNVNGTFDEGDSPVQGITVLLDGGKYRTVSGPDGSYEFGEIGVGEHRISVLPRSVRADLVLIENHRRKLNTAAFERSSVDFRLGLNRTVTGQVYFDENENGQRDPDEIPVRDVRLLINGRQDTMTGADGSFSLGDVPPGRQTLLVDPSSVPRGLISPRSLEVLIPSEVDPEVVWIPIRPKPKHVIRKSFSSTLGQGK